MVAGYPDTPSGNRDPAARRSGTAERYPDLIDTHAHITSPEFDRDRGEVLDRARKYGVGFVEVGFDIESSRRAVDIAGTEALAAAVGIHPHNAADYAKDLDGAWKEIRALAGESAESLARTGRRRVVAIGEIGLDYYRDLSPRSLQADCFALGLELAKKLSLPVIIHQRDAEEDVLAILKNSGLDLPVIFHCFSGNKDSARRALDLGGYLGIGGTVTYPRNTELRDLLRFIPLTRILLETDAPYLAPQSRRGRRNEPAYVLEFRDTVASQLDVEPSRAGTATRDNAVRLLGL
jgi:TatD DNase family protein